ncbi:hypothetical protein ACLKA6_013885 [Drosophila palustris]
MLPGCRPQVNDANGAVLSPVYRRDSADQPLLRRQIVLGDDHQLSNDDVWRAMVPLAPDLESQNVLLGPSPPELSPERRDSSPST